MTFPKNKDDHEGKIDKGEGSPPIGTSLFCSWSLKFTFKLDACVIFDIYNLKIKE